MSAADLTPAGTADAGRVESTPSARWRAEGKQDPFGDRYDCERAKLGLGKMTDDELANAVFIHGGDRLDLAAIQRGEPSPISLLTAAKDRIRWLSRQLEAARSASPAPAGGGAAGLRLCGYCHFWQPAPCGKDCCLQPTDPTWDTLNAAAPTPRPAPEAHGHFGEVTAEAVALMQAAPTRSHDEWLDVSRGQIVSEALDEFKAKLDAATPAPGAGVDLAGVVDKIASAAANALAAHGYVKSSDAMTNMHGIIQEETEPFIRALFRPAGEVGETARGAIATLRRIVAERSSPDAPLGVLDGSTWVSMSLTDLRALDAATASRTAGAEAVYVVWSNEHTAWWGPNECGYRSNLAHAGRYTREHAIKLATMRDGRHWGSARLANPPEIAIREDDALAIVSARIAAKDRDRASGPEGGEGV